MLFLIFAIIGGVIGFIFGFTDYYDFVEGLFGWFAGIFLGLLLSLIVACVSLAFTQPQEEELTQDIVALADNPRYEHYKNGYLVCNGSEQLKYAYMYKTDKGLTVKEVNANKSYIQTISDDKTPYVKITTIYYKNILVGKVITSHEYTFYLPPNSIVTDYKIDLQ